MNRSATVVGMDSAKTISSYPHAMMLELAILELACDKAKGKT